MSNSVIMGITQSPPLLMLANNTTRPQSFKLLPDDSAVQTSSQKITESNVPPGYLSLQLLSTSSIMKPSLSKISQPPSLIVHNRVIPVPPKPTEINRIIPTPTKPSMNNIAIPVPIKLSVIPVPTKPPVNNIVIPVPTKPPGNNTQPQYLKLSTTNDTKL